MSESSQMQPGWYYAQGDAPGTQRYWDGTQWVGGPQPVGEPQPQDSPAHGGGQGGFSGAEAEYGQRATAWAIDVLPYFVVGFISRLLGAGAGAAGVLGALLSLGALGYLLWNKGYRMGSTGQSLGKASQNIKLVKADTGQPIGVGVAFARLLVSLVFLLLGVIPYLIDHLWPLWDNDKQRLMDKIFHTRSLVA